MENPLIRKLIRLSKSCIGEAEKKAVRAVLDREYLGMGKDVEKFENLLTKFFGRPAICVSNGTAALQLSIQACEIGYKDEVLVPSLTYVASFQAISATGAIPIACDIDEKTCLISLRDAETKITSKTKAVMPVHYTGGVGNLDELYSFADKYNLRVIEDAAHAFGSIYKNKKVGGFGDIACFSFDGIKNITSGEGGCITSNDLSVLNNVKDSRLLGVEKDSDRRYLNERTWDFNVHKQGWRYHMSNIMASIGIEQLNRFEEFSEKRKKYAKRYDLLFNGHSNLSTIPRDYENVVPHIYVIRVKNLKDRKKLQLSMLEKNIQVGYHYQPNHVLDFYHHKNNNYFPNTDVIFPQLVSLPLHTDLVLSDIDYIADHLIKLTSDLGI